MKEKMNSNGMKNKTGKNDILSAFDFFFSFTDICPTQYSQ